MHTNNINSLRRKIRLRLAAILNRMAERIRPTAHGLNLAGDRDIEWTWVLANLPTGPGKALDVGPGPFAFISITAARKGFETTAIDLRKFDWPVSVGGLTTKTCDLLEYPLPKAAFDLVVVCSTIEHVGLPGHRYGNQVETGDADIRAMAILRTAAKPGATLLLTLPVGTGGAFPPHHRVYDRQRLGRLLDGWVVDRSEFWTKQVLGVWAKAAEADAFATQGSATFFALGCFALTKPDLVQT